MIKERHRYRLPAQPLTLWQLLRCSLQLWGAVCSMWLVYLLLYISCLVLLDVALEAWLPVEAFSPENIPLVVGALLLNLLLLVLINSLFLGAMLLRLQLFALGQSCRMLDGLRLALHKLPTLLLAGVLYTISISFGGVLLLLPGLMLAVSLSLYGYFVLLQDAGALEALAASRALIRGYWWRMLAGYAMPTIVLSASLLLLPQLQILPAGYWLYAVVQNALLGLFGSYFIVLGWLQYQDLQVRKRGCVSKGRTP